MMIQQIRELEHPNTITMKSAGGVKYKVHVAFPHSLCKMAAMILWGGKKIPRNYFNTGRKKCFLCFIILKFKCGPPCITVHLLTRTKRLGMETAIVGTRCFPPEEGAQLGRRMCAGATVPGCVWALSPLLNQQACLKHTVLHFPRL